MTMLEDELRHLFHARVRTPPAALDPAGTAIDRGRNVVGRRRTMIGSAVTLVFALALAGVASINGIWGTPKNGNDAVTYDALYGRPGHEDTDRNSEALPSMSMPVDVHVGTALWTTDGRKLTLPGVQEVISIVRVPDGWLYSDDYKLRLLTVGGQFVPVRDDVLNWAVSADGDKVATVRQGDTLAVSAPGGGDGPATSVPGGVRAVGFDGGRVVLSRDRASDLWGAESTAYQETWNEQLLVVYGGGSGDAIGLYQEGPDICLVDLRAGSGGWEARSKLGCGDLLATAARAGYGLSRAVRSPDGRWLAVPSPTGVHMIDIHASRLTKPETPAVAYTCISAPDAPAVWADSATMLTIGSADSVVACGIDGVRRAVILPEGVSDGWALVRRYGVTG